MPDSPSHRARALCLPASLVLALTWSLIPSPVAADDLENEFLDLVEPVIMESCMECHDDAEAKGGISFDLFERIPTGEDLFREQKKWRRVADMLETAQMPPDPAEAKAIPLETRLEVASWLRTAIEEYRCDENHLPAATVPRRLTRDEYANTMEALFGVELPVEAYLAADDHESFGFSNTAHALPVTKAAYEKYLMLADKALDEVFQGSKLQQLVKGEQTWPTQLQTALETEDGADPETAHAAIKAFASAAFRRPVQASEIEPLIQVYDTVFLNENDGAMAIQQAFRAALISPWFLYRVAPDNLVDDSLDSHRDYDLASRLSYFLWSTSPDAELLRHAQAGVLHDPTILRKQVQRMIADERFEAFPEHFANGWLFHDVEAVAAEGSIFPTYDRSMEYAAKEEIVRTMEKIFRDNRPIDDLIDADYVVINHELAEFYELPFDETQEGWIEVKVDDPRRGGLLTMAAALQRTSKANRTSPTKRGLWVLANILGTPPPPPPANVEAINEAETEGQNEEDRALTFREKLALHRDQSSSCAGCHQRMDPLGYALENYDAVGRWRTHEAEIPIDATGQLPSGHALDGIVSLKMVLMERRDQVVRHLIEQMLVYALGRGLEWQDQCAVRDIFESVKADDYRAGTLLEAIVMHPLFQGAPTIHGPVAANPNQ